MLKGIARSNTRQPRIKTALVLNLCLKFSKINLPFVFPTFSNDPLVIVPPACVRDILNRPETDLEARGPQRDLIQAPYTIQEKEVYINDFHMRLARKELTRNLPLLTEDIANEIALGFERFWGSPTEWSTVTVQDSIIGVLAGVANRVIAGAELCMKNSPKSMKRADMRDVKVKIKNSLSIQYDTR